MDGSGSYEGRYLVRSDSDLGEILEVLPEGADEAEARERALAHSAEYAVRLEFVVQDDDDETVTELLASFEDGEESDGDPLSE